MINLEYERGDQTGLIKIMNNNDRKDRYTSVSYGNYFAQMLEHDLLSDTAEYDYVHYLTEGGDEVAERKEMVSILEAE